MDIHEISRQLTENSAQIEKSFIALSSYFPELLNKQGGSSMEKIQLLLGEMNTQNSAAEKIENSFFSGYDQKYSSVFTELNKKIEYLSTVNDQVKTIKEDSEEMELIALNAMVISIKSGEKGRAFSAITENLKQLSNNMFSYSNQLISEEERLLQTINSLKSKFSNIVDTQKQLSSISEADSAQINTLITSTSQTLTSLSDTVGSLYPPIQKAMEGLQMQDIIRQALEHVQMCLHESSELISSGTDSLDNICFEAELLRLSQSVLSDVNGYMSSSIAAFTANWDIVTARLEDVDRQKNSFLSVYIKSSSPDTNILLRIDQTVNGFHDLMSRFSSYMIIQKDLERTCNDITDRARIMYSVFENLSPVVKRLHHVRILQQIEVSKNPAISSVRDSVTDMDKLITSANNSLDTMEKMFKEFIADTEKVLSSFSDKMRNDNDQMKNVRTAKNSFFTVLRNGQTDMADILQHFTVFPEGFENTCKEVNTELSRLKSVQESFSQIIIQMQTEEKELTVRKTQLMNEQHIAEWEIKNDRLKELIKKFTITAHKQAAAEIGGFGVEKGADTGDVTFF